MDSTITIMVNHHNLSKPPFWKIFVYFFQSTLNKQIQGVDRGLLGGGCRHFRPYLGKIPINCDMFFSTGLLEHVGTTTWLIIF